MSTDMHPADIKCLLEKRGITQQQIADELGICSINISRVIYGLANSERVRQAVCRAIERDPKEVFAEYYNRPPFRRHGKAPSIEKINAALVKTNGHRGAAARLLGISQTTVYDALTREKKRKAA